MTMIKKPKGFVLIREYPGCNRKVGSFEKYTTGEFLRYSEIWKPVYDKVTETVTTKDHIIDITVTDRNKR